MNPNGILFLWWLDKNNPGDAKPRSHATRGWPIWACGLLGRGMAAYYAGSGDKRVLQTLEAGYSGDRNWLRLGRWHVERLARVSNLHLDGEQGDRRGPDNVCSRKTAAARTRRGGPGTGTAGCPTTKPGAEANDHGVAFLEGTTPWALGYLWTGNRDFLAATIGWHDLLERVAMQPSGVPVADEYYGPTGAFRGTETCDVAGYLWSQIVLLTVSGEGRMADRAERAFFNAGPADRLARFQDPRLFPEPQPHRR